MTASKRMSVFHGFMCFLNYHFSRLKMSYKYSGNISLTQKNLEVLWAVKQISNIMLCQQTCQQTCHEICQQTCQKTCRDIMQLEMYSQYIISKHIKYDDTLYIRIWVVIWIIIYLDHLSNRLVTTRMKYYWFNHQMSYQSYRPRGP